ncbi:fibrinogen C domain-containing protein 1 isoform X2 [Manduca sexta]|uniref:Fibrinogen C-terminal domain-containing protein n=1 Tax=Manduca sexta TaxID=7130 RepID=A0A921Z745_MANSE|nr:fibrinogen C domain-containing protein 1 isoform X2 [Manduca sexta]KAG6452175.1 hypothetical protein O3G_MSEX007504 [Manduca sexta]
MCPRNLTVLLLLCLFTLILAKKESYRTQEKSNSASDNSSRKKNENMPTTTGRVVGDAVVEKFVETLMSSERYLKMIEIVERKLNHLDATFHEKVNAINKYLAEILRIVKSPSDELLENSLKGLKGDLDKLKYSITSKEHQPNMRVDGAEYHVDSFMENRLSVLDTNVKNIMAGVDTIVSTINEVKNRQYARTFVKQEANSVSGVMDAATLIGEFRKTLREQKNKKCDCKMGRIDRSERYPTDCHEIQMQGFNVSGIYKIKPDEMEPFYVLCDLTTAGGGWTVLQNRFDGSQDFYKGWSDYENGFGNLAGEFWLGLEKISYLTNQKLYELRIEIETQHGQDGYAGYSVFTVGPELEGYRISTLGTYYGTAGDSLSYHAGQKFSTFDMDNDEWKDGSCSAEHGGAWWYKECDKSNLNGKYSLSADENRGQTIYWISFKGPNYPLTKTKMMIRPLPASKPIDFGDGNRKVRMKDVKVTYDMGHKHAPHRYDDHTRAEAFFPNYA